MMELMASCVFRVAGARVIIGQRAEIVPLDQTIQRDGGAGGAVQFARRAIGLHGEDPAEFGHARLDLRGGHLPAQRGQFVHFDVLDMAAEGGAMLGDVGVNIQHSAVVMPHQAQAVVGHDMGDAGGLDPGVHFVPAGRIIVQHAGDLVEGDAATLKDAGDFRHRAGAAMRQPFAGHRGAVGHFVKRRVVNGRGGLEIQDDDRHAGAPHHGQNRGGKRIGGDMQEDEVHVLLAEPVSGLHRPGRGVNEAQVDDFHARAAPGGLRRCA